MKIELVKFKDCQNKMRLRFALKYCKILHKHGQLESDSKEKEKLVFM